MASRKKVTTQKSKTSRRSTGKRKKSDRKSFISLLVILCAAILGWIFGSTFLAR